MWTSSLLKNRLLQPQNKEKYWKLKIYTVSSQTQQRRLMMAKARYFCLPLSVLIAGLRSVYPSYKPLSVTWVAFKNSSSNDGSAWRRVGRMSLVDDLEKNWKFSPVGHPGWTQLSSLFLKGQPKSKQGRNSNQNKGPDLGIPLRFGVLDVFWGSSQKVDVQGDGHEGQDKKHRSCFVANSTEKLVGILKNCMLRS